ncbi:MAG: tetratricopeptide repeat protein [Bacteroidales bacterium]
MASIIPGYEYDIFISYRQKDNKGDRWVSEFVEALKTELESTFKEEISVYFDINPHDGLLETHDVDESLKEKLKCLVFIPIFSRTYCDPKSFAWEHEFKAFVEQASKDQFGLKVKLPNGNVASRVLPVRIHDLDTADSKLCESVLGGVLRGIEFIYKEPGVDRPLSAKDHEEKNLNKTNYRNQINKVALAIREIIPSIGQLRPQQEGESKKISNPVSFQQRIGKTRIIAGSVIALALVILGILFIPKLFKPKEQLEKSIAVLPFINDSPDEENAYFINGVMEEVLINLQKIKDLRVISRNSVEQFRGPDKPTIPEIAKKLNVNYLVEGSGQKYGNKFVLRVQLIAANKERHLWGKSYDREIQQTTDIISVHREIAELIASELKASLTPEEKQLIRKNPTDNLEAYNLYLKGTYWYQMLTAEGHQKASMYFEQALQKDPNYSLAYLGLANAIGTYAFWGNVSPKERNSKGIEYVTKALTIDSTLAEAYWVLGNHYTFSVWNWKEAERNYKHALQINPNSSQIHADYSNLLTITRRHEEAISEAKRAHELDPISANINLYLGAALYYAHQWDAAIEEIQTTLAINPNFSAAHFVLGLVYYSKKMYKEAVEAWEKAVDLSGGNPLMTSWLISGYYLVGEKDLADKQFDGLKKRSETEYVPPTSFFLIHMIRGEEEMALDWLKRACDEHDTILPWFKFSFPEGSRYRALLKEAGLL